MTGGGDCGYLYDAGGAEVRRTHAYRGSSTLGWQWVEANGWRSKNDENETVLDAAVVHYVCSPDYLFVKHAGLYRQE